VEAPWIDKVRESLQAYLRETTGATQASIARQTGFAQSVISGFLGRRYNGDSAKVARQVEAVLGLAAQRAAIPAAPGFKMTAIARAVMGLLDRCLVDCEFGIVTGDAGVGKTMALAHFVQLQPTSLLFRARKSDSSAQDMLRRLGPAAGIQTPKGRSGALDALIGGLSGTGRLLIIDEGQRISDDGLECLRDLHDEARVGIVLAGNATVQERVYGTGTAAFSQHYSRLGARLELSPQMITGEDVDLLVGELPGDGSEQAAARATLLKFARSRGGGLRTMMKTYTLAHCLHSEAGGDFNSLLNTAHRMRGIN